MGSDIVKWGDVAMFEAQPILREEGTRVTPRVFLLSATPDPLGNIAADFRMYRGDPPYSLNEVTDEQRREFWNEVMTTHATTPLEGVTMKFMLEAVTRSFTHQAVRQRVGAYYVQESLRFAVKRGLAQEAALPPYIVKNNEAAWDTWHNTLATIEEAYNKLVDAGIPAEDARGLLPHCVTTRMYYHTNLRALYEWAGKRLCTQAQFEWRMVFMGIMKALAEEKGPNQTDVQNDGGIWSDYPEAWQWELIAEPRPQTFTPVCYKAGRCVYMGKLDRACTIRDRVEAFHAAGVKPENWGQGVHDKAGIQGINPEEWMLNPEAGITLDDSERPQR